MSLVHFIALQYIAQGLELLGELYT